MREFYPDDLFRLRIHYSFAHIFLPDYIHGNAQAIFGYLFGDKPMNPTRFIQSRWCMMEMKTGLAPRPESLDDITCTPFRRVSDLEGQLQDIAGRPGFLIQMPGHEVPVPHDEIVPPLAFFVGVVFGEDHSARVFTLERMIDPPAPDMNLEDWGILCEWISVEGRANHGMVVPSQKKAFVDAITKVLSPPDGQSVSE